MTEMAGFEPAGDASALQGWDALVPDESIWHNRVGECSARRELVRDLRNVADFLESRLDVPVPRHAQLPLIVFAAGTATEKRAQVEYAASLLRTTPVDETSRGGHYVAEKTFGNLAYRFVDISKTAERAAMGGFTIAQDVRLAPEAARIFVQYGMPLAGVVTEQVAQESGAVLYQVRLIGGQRMYFTPAMLEALTLEPVTTTRGAVGGLSEAETALVGSLARCEFRWAEGRPARTADTADATALSSAVAEVCGLPRDKLDAALNDLVSREVGRLQTAEHAARREAVAALGASRRSPSGRSDSPRRGHGR